MMNLYNRELGKFFKDYSNNVNNEDYKLKVDLCYKNGIKSDKKSRVYIKSLKNYLNRVGIKMNGVFVNEMSKNYFIHNHCLIWVNCDYSLGKKYIWNYWVKKYNIGSVKIDRYDSDLGYNFYMSKFIGSSEKNNYELIEML